MITVTAQMASEYLPVLADDAHKYSRGMCDLVVGSPLYAGAGVLAAGAANVMGAGYIRVYSCPEVAAALHVCQPSAVVKKQDTFFNDKHIETEGHPSAVVMGCGLDLNCKATSMSFVREVIHETRVPLVLDGTALSYLMTAEAPAVLETRLNSGYATVVTPHLGEASRFAGLGRCDDLAQWALNIAHTLFVTCVLKGAQTFIADPSMTSTDEVLCMSEGTAVLAKAGTGDVLAGMLGSLLAQGVDQVPAACAATFIHARAGEIAKSTQGVCTTTEDVLSCIPAAVGSLK